MQKKTGDRDHPQGLISKAEFLAVMKESLQMVYRWK